MTDTTYRGYSIRFALPDRCWIEKDGCCIATAEAWCVGERALAWARATIDTLLDGA